jgi:hypothetical protein
MLTISARVKLIEELLSALDSTISKGFCCFLFVVLATTDLADLKSFPIVS